MRKLLNLIALVIIVGSIFLLVQNFGQNIDFTVFTQGNEHFVKKDFDISFLFGSFLALGFLAGAAIFGGMNLDSKNRLKEYKRKIETVSINADSSDSRVAVLESKIEVLEKALKTALEKNTD